MTRQPPDFTFPKSSLCQSLIFPILHFANHLARQSIISSLFKLSNSSFDPEIGTKKNWSEPGTQGNPLLTVRLGTRNQLEPIIFLKAGTQLNRNFRDCYRFNPEPWNPEPIIFRSLSMGIFI